MWGRIMQTTYEELSVYWTHTTRGEAGYALGMII